MAAFFEYFRDVMRQAGFEAPAALFASPRQARQTVQIIADAIRAHAPGVTLGQLTATLSSGAPAALPEYCRRSYSRRALSFLTACVGALGSANWKANWEGRRVPSISELTAVDLTFILAEHKLEIAPRERLAIQLEFPRMAPSPPARRKAASPVRKQPVVKRQSRRRPK